MNEHSVKAYRSTKLASELRKLADAVESGSAEVQGLSLKVLGFRDEVDGADYRCTSTSGFRVSAELHAKDGSTVLVEILNLRPHSP